METDMNMRNSQLSRSFFLLPVLLVLIAGATLALTGCGGNESPSGPGKTTSDAELIKAQEVCPTTGKKLGSMGKPIKVTLKGQPVFL